MQSLLRLPRLYLGVYLEHVGSTCPRLGHRRLTTLCFTLNETWLNDSMPLPYGGIDIVPSTLDIRTVFYKSIRIYLLSSKHNSTKSFFHLRLPVLLLLCVHDRPFLLCTIYLSFFLSASYSPSPSFTPLPHIALFVISFYRSISLALSPFVSYIQEIW